MYKIYTDGGCRSNDGNSPCSWAFVVYDISGKYLGKKSGSIAKGTNNIGELTAIERTMTWLAKRKNDNAVIHTDSAYAQNGCNMWVNGWKTKGWKKSDGQTIKNKEIWMRIWDLKQELSDSVKVAKVKGHSGVEGNELADKYCNEELDKLGE